MTDDIQNLESFLREFEPRRPRPLPIAAMQHRSLRWFAAAAALILVCGVGALWLVSQQRAGRATHGSAHLNSSPARATQNVPAIVLTREALASDPSFDQELDSMARRSLPNFDRNDSTLRVLASE